MARTTYAIIAAMAGIVILGRGLKDEYLIGGCILLIATLVILYFIGILWFANKNPAAAMTEGATFLKYQETEWTAKGMLNQSTALRIVDPKGPSAPPPTDG